MTPCSDVLPQSWPGLGNSPHSLTQCVDVDADDRPDARVAARVSSVHNLRVLLHT